MWRLALLPLIFTDNSLALGGFFICMSDQCFSFPTSCRPLGLSPCRSQISLLWYFVSLVPCPGTLYYLHLPKLSILFPQCRRFAGFPCVFSPCSTTWNISKIVNSSNNRAYLIDFYSLRNHCTLFLDFHFPENMFVCLLGWLLFFVLFCYLILEGETGPCFFILARSRSCFVLFLSLE